MAQTTVQHLGEFGQSIWLDNINRSMIETGKLESMIDRGLRGLTSNPTIFDKSISTSSDYDREIRKLATAGKAAFGIYDDLTVRDVQDAADIFKYVYEKTAGLDGYVSLEVNPNLASDVAETIKEAKRLYRKVNRPNVMFKIPATEEGFSAIEELTAESMNINATLIFSRSQYENVARAFIRGLEKLSSGGGDLTCVRSVASVFVSRVDTLVDRMLDDLIEKEPDGGARNKLLALKGKAAVANSKTIFKRYTEMFADEDFRSLEYKGANIQRVLWGSTSTKNPEYSDIKYVQELMARGTVNTIPENTFEAFLDHGVVREAVTPDADEAFEIIAGLSRLGIDVDSVCERLLRDGVSAFQKSFNSLLEAIDKKKSVCVKS